MAHTALHTADQAPSYRIGEALPPIPARPAASERTKPFRGAVPVERVWLLFAANVRGDLRFSVMELGLNPASAKPRLFWRRFPMGSETELHATAEKLRAIGVKATIRTKTAARRR